MPKTSQMDQEMDQTDQEMDQNGLGKGLKWNGLFQSFFRIFANPMIS